MSDQFQSWGRYPKISPERVMVPYWKSEVSLPNNAVTIQGQARSYGDACLTADGTLISTKQFNHAIHFDSEHGLFTAEAGISLDHILSIIVPKGFFLPVSPGTKFVSLGGAIANDIHGKNHHAAGTFGRFVKRLSLLRSTGEVLECSATQNSEYFCATIAGIGLTGLILDATIQLIPIGSSFINQKVEKFLNIESFFELSQKSNATYSVAWIDCLTEKNGLGRGHFITGEHANSGSYTIHKDPIISCPFNFPSWALNRLTIQAFNTLYYNRLLKEVTENTVHYDPFFYPLDGVNYWNRMYGRSGFLQFQCVVPLRDKKIVIVELLKEAKKSGTASFLAVLKEFGSIQSPGLLSFPREGVTLTLDFAFKGEKTLQLFKTLEAITMEAGGALYAAKDAVMTKEHFHSMYPRLQEFLKYKDPLFSSALSRRVI